MFKYSVMIGAIVLLAACGGQRIEITEVEGNTAERVAKISETLGKDCQLPSPLVDARMALIYYNNGGGCVPGPSDSFRVGVLTVAPTNFPAWQKMFAADKTNSYGVDRETGPAWWKETVKNLGDLETLTYFDPHPLLDCQVGSVTFQGDSNIIFNVYR